MHIITQYRFISEGNKSALCYNDYDHHNTDFVVVFLVENVCQSSIMEEKHC